MLKKDLTIVINTFNSDEKIYSCLDSVDDDINILIIENSNNHNFKEKLEKKYTNVHCELTGKNLGYAKGNNFGLSKVKSNFALILNPDTVIKNKTIENFFITSSKYSDFSIIAPAIQEKKDIDAHINTNNIIEVDSVKGFAMFLNLNPNIIIEHIGGSSHNQSINFEMELSRNWHWMWSTFYYHKKHYGFISAFFKVSLKLTSSIFKLFLYSVLFNENKKKIYYQRFSGLLSSILGKKSWYRPKVF